MKEIRYFSLRQKFEFLFEFLKGKRTIDRQTDRQTDRHTDRRTGKDRTVKAAGEKRGEKEEHIMSYAVKVVIHAKEPEFFRSTQKSRLRRSTIFNVEKTLHFCS